jgi:membrane protein
VSLRSHPTVVRTIERTRDIAERLIAVRIVETSIVLAAQAFLALFPLILVVAAVVPRDVSTSLLNELRSRYGVSGTSAGALQSVLIDRGAVQQSLSAISILLVIGSATAFTRALQRMYQNSWGLPKLGLRGLWRGFAWLIGLITYLAILGAIAHVIHHGGVVAPVSTVLGFGLWWWTPFLLLGGRVRARALIPAAVIITTSQLIAGLLSSAIVPRTIRNNESNYGPIGAVFAFESWLVIVMGVLVVGTALGAAIGLANNRLGCWIRGTSDPDGWRRVPKPVRVGRAKDRELNDEGPRAPGRDGVAAIGGQPGEPETADHAASVVEPVGGTGVSEARRPDDGRDGDDREADKRATDGKRTTL